MLNYHKGIEMAYSIRGVQDFIVCLFAVKYSQSFSKEPRWKKNGLHQERRETEKNTTLSGNISKCLNYGNFGSNSSYLVKV